MQEVPTSLMVIHPTKSFVAEDPPGTFHVRSKDFIKAMAFTTMTPSTLCGFIFGMYGGYVTGALIRAMFEMWWVETVEKKLRFNKSCRRVCHEEKLFFTGKVMLT